MTATVDLDEVLRLLAALEQEALDAAAAQPGLKPYFEARANAFQEARHKLMKRFRP